MKPLKTVTIGNIKMGAQSPLVLIAGPCVIEARKDCLQLAGRLVELSQRFKIPLIFKASYDKANRTSIDAYRGPGIAKGLEILSAIKERYPISVLTDIHSEAEVALAAHVVDVLQIPAFLCRQTDLLVAAGESGKVVNIKKGQFLAPSEMMHIVKKIEHTGNRKILITERGSSWGYGNLVVDMRSLVIMRECGYPIIFDATHSVQRPGSSADGFTPGDGPLAPSLARAAVAVGCQGVFLEVHMQPAKALSDAQNMLPFKELGKLWEKLNAIDRVLKSK